MSSLQNNPLFRADFEKLKAVSLNPARHAARNAHEHSGMVAQRAVDLAALNGCTAEETALLCDLAHVHDIGKIAGTANPEASVSLLANYGVTAERFINLVKYHDTNLPWHQAAQRGEPPSDKAWNKLARKVDVRLLCLFMVADRADCPGGWRANRPLVWFLEEVKRRGLLSPDLVLDEGPAVPAAPTAAAEVSAGAVLVRRSGSEAQALLIRVRKRQFEVPKGHVEPLEAKEAAAVRELREETGILSPVDLGPEIGVLDYPIQQDGIARTKTVFYFAASARQGNPIQFGPPPAGTREVRWVSSAELSALPLVNEELRSIIVRALEMACDE